MPPVRVGPVGLDVPPRQVGAHPAAPEETTSSRAAASSASGIDTRVLP
ncbi:hypothetical protein ACFQ60_16465 [Streptomyces zhihengii]